MKTRKLDLGKKNYKSGAKEGFIFHLSAKG
ncbi:hypothetical protein J2X69_001219 [Algoriphagus sp. 4150]|nr:hypothetical protein [Algoriphagus sp. 4150]